MGLTIGTYGATDATGWSVATPTAPFAVGTGTSPAGSRIICVSNAGNDTTGDGSFATPYATPTKGNGFLRDGFPDWLLFRRGDTFLDSIQIRYSGLSPTERIVISNYDQATFNPSAPVCDPGPPVSTARPIYKGDWTLGSAIAGSGGGGAPATSGQNLFIGGIDFTAHTRDPSSPTYDPSTVFRGVSGIGMLWTQDSFLVENCRFRWFSENVGITPTASDTAHTTNFIFRRCVLNNSYTIDSNGGGMHLGGLTGFLIEESCFDHNYYASSTVIFTISAPAVPPTAGAVYSDGTISYTVVSTVGTLLTTTTSGIPSNRSGTLTKTSGTGDASISFSQISVTTSGIYGFDHNIYVSAYNDEFDPAAVTSGMVFRGNIMARDPSTVQFRSGGQITNNLCIQNPQPFIVAFPVAGEQTVISNNVVIEAKGNPPQPYEAGFGTGGFEPQYGLGPPFSFDSNIHCHTTRANGGSGISVNSNYVGTISNDIFFDWNTPLIDATGGGILTFGAITAGSGATAMPTFSGYIDDNSTPGTYSGVAGHFLTVTAITGTPLTDGMQLTWPGMAGGTFLNIYDKEDFSGSGGGTGIYQIHLYPGAHHNIAVAPTTFTVQNWFLSITGGSGSGAKAIIKTTGTGGGVASCVIWDGQMNNEVPSQYMTGGVGYVANDSVSAAVPGVTGFSVLVSTVASVTQTSNRLDASGANVTPPLFPDPGRTIGSYMSSIGLGSTTNDYFTAIANQNKSNWNPALTANAVNTYIRAGFGIGETIPPTPTPKPHGKGHIHHNVAWKPVR